MPNWVYNKVLIEKTTKENAEAIMNSALDKDGNFDFNKIVPMPEALVETESSPYINQSLRWYYDVTNHESPAASSLIPKMSLEISRNLFKILDKAGVFAYSSPDEYPKPQTRSEEKRYLETAKKHLDILQKYGVLDWYSWSLTYWGCKWNASDAHIEEGAALFDTPWTPPVQVLLAWSEQHPEVRIRDHWEEEQGFGSDLVFENGRCWEENPFDCYAKEEEYE